MYAEKLDPHRYIQLESAGAAVLRQVAARAREDFNLFVPIVMRDSTGKPLEQEPIHRVWDHHFNLCWAAGKHPALFAPWAHGKCGTRFDTVQSIDGSRIPLPDWKGGETLALDPTTHRLVPAFAPASWPNGIKPTLRIRTRSGRETVVTHEHPFRLLGRWIEARDLQLGMRIAAPRWLPKLGTGEVEDVWLLGVLVGDGCLSQHSVGISKECPIIRAEIRRVAHRRGWLVRDDETMFLTNDFVRGGSPLDFTRSHGLQGCDAYSKRVPSAIFTSSDESIAEFLSGYLDTDAHVSQHGGGSVEFYSVSKDLLRDVQHLLVRIGVVAVLAPKLGQYDGKPHHSWRLTVRGDALLRLEVLHPRGKRLGELAALLEMQRAKTPESGDGIDRLPPEAVDLIRSSEDWLRKNRLLRPYGRAAMTREKARKIAKGEGNDELLALADAEILWDEVVEIEDAGEQETWALSVPGLENYVGDDLIQHNSVQMVARVCWLLGKLPSRRIKIVSNSDKNAMKRVIECGRILQSPAYRLVFPWISLDLMRLDVLKGKQKKTGARLTQHEIIVNRPAGAMAIDASIEAAGITSSGIGGRADVLFFDDVIDQKNAIDQPDTRERISEDFDMVWMSRLDPGGMAALIGTFWHQADHHHKILKRKAWCSLRQFVSDDLTRIDQEVYNPPPGYLGPPNGFPIWTDSSRSVAPKKTRAMIHP